MIRPVIWRKLVAIGIAALVAATGTASAVTKSPGRALPQCGSIFTARSIAKADGGVAVVLTGGSWKDSWAGAEGTMCSYQPANATMYPDTQVPDARCLSIGQAWIDGEWFAQ